jgi:hypothetical protein
MDKYAILNMGTKIKLNGILKENDFDFFPNTQEFLSFFKLNISENNIYLIDFLVPSPGNIDYRNIGHKANVKPNGKRKFGFNLLTLYDKISYIDPKAKIIVPYLSEIESIKNFKKENPQFQYYHHGEDDFQKVMSKYLKA